MNVDRLLLLAVVLLTLCRWGLAGALELTGEEAIYWLESSRLAPFYMEHGPLPAWLIRMGEGGFGEGQVMAVRCFNPLLVLVATWLLYRLARSVYHQVAARWAVVVFQLCPLTNVAGVCMLDAALALCLVLATLWCVWIGLHRVRRWHGAWLGGGLCLGALTSLSLPLGALVALGWILAMSVPSRWRAQWGRPGMWLMLGVSVALPIGLVMASGHGSWVWMRVVRGWGESLRFSPLSGLAWALWMGPLLVVGCAWLGGRWRSSRRDAGAAFLALAGVMSLVASGVAAVVQPAASSLLWTGAIPCFIVLAGEWMQADLPLEIKGRWRWWALLTTGGLAVVGVNTENLRMVGVPWPRAWDTPRLEQGWQESMEALEATLSLGQAHQPEGLFLIAEDSETAALLEFYLPPGAPVFQPDPRFPRVHVIESAGWETVHDLWANYSHALAGSEGNSPFLGMTGLYVTGAGWERLPGNLRNAFDSMEPAAVVTIQRRGRTLREWQFIHLYDYQGLPL